jgi:predicted MFS family arabinose efflux permease
MSRWAVGEEAWTGSKSGLSRRVLGQFIGWRGAFLCIVPVALLTFTWQLLTLPPMPSQRGARTGGVFRVLGKRQVPLGMVAAAALFMGPFTLFT